MKKWIITLIAILGLASSGFAQEFSVGGAIQLDGRLGAGVHGDFAVFRLGNWGLGVHATGNVGTGGMILAAAPIVYFPGEIIDGAYDKWVAYAGIGLGTTGTGLGTEYLFGLRYEISNIDIFAEAVSVAPFARNTSATTIVSIGLNLRFTTGTTIEEPTLSEEPQTP